MSGHCSTDFLQTICLFFSFFVSGAYSIIIIINFEVVAHLEMEAELTWHFRRNLPSYRKFFVEVRKYGSPHLLKAYTQTNINCHFLIQTRWQANARNINSPKSNKVHAFGFTSPLATLPYFFSARSLILDLHHNEKVCLGDGFRKWNRESIYPIASIWGRENAVVMMKKRAQ